MNNSSLAQSSEQHGSKRFIPIDDDDDDEDGDNNIEMSLKAAAGAS